MARISKPELKPFVAAWLDELDTCFERRPVWDCVTKKQVTREVLAHPPVSSHIGRLHGLIEADYSPVVPRAEVEEYIRKLEASGQQVPLERKEFPAGYYWTIIKKWDRWRKLRVIHRIRRYVKLLPEFWEQHWRRHGGEKSPYTREWLHYDNLENAYASVGLLSKQQQAKLNRQFPAVAIMLRIEKGEAARASDIEPLERWASPWCKKHATPLDEKLDARLRGLDMNAAYRKERIHELRNGVAELYATVLALDIQARHQKAMAVIRSWEEGWGVHVSSYFRFLSNVEFIRQLREVMPLRNVGDPDLEQKKRIKESKRASEKRNRSAD